MRVLLRRIVRVGRLAGDAAHDAGDRGRSQNTTVFVRAVVRGAAGGRYPLAQIIWDPEGFRLDPRDIQHLSGEHLLAPSHDASQSVDWLAVHPQLEVDLRAQMRCVAGRELQQTDPEQSIGDEGELASRGSTPSLVMDVEGGRWTVMLRASSAATLSPRHWAPCKDLGWRHVAHCHDQLDMDVCVARQCVAHEVGGTHRVQSSAKCDAHHIG